MYSNNNNKIETHNFNLIPFTNAARFMVNVSYCIVLQYFECMSLTGRATEPPIQGLEYKVPKFLLLILKTYGNYVYFGKILRNCCRTTKTAKNGTHCRAVCCQQWLMGGKLVVINLIFR